MACPNRTVRNRILAAFAFPVLALPVSATATALDYPRPETALLQPAHCFASCVKTAGKTDPIARSVPPVSARRSPDPDPEGQVGAANISARIEPDEARFRNAIQHFAYHEGALYQIYTRPGQVTDIMLQEGEQLVGPGPVAAGDTLRWMIGDTLSGSGESTKVHILVKPTRTGIATNLVINTDRRTYHVELHSASDTYMAGVRWTYPADEMIALRRKAGLAERTAPVARDFRIEDLNFSYRISGDRPEWRPVRVFDDSVRTFIEFAPQVRRGELPPFFIIGDGGKAELANYRVAGNYIIVDAIFRTAELRLGSGKKQVHVRIQNRGGGQS